jgi:septal ring factor EnvC (AmiA/AmiB activator)
VVKHSETLKRRDVLLLLFQAIDKSESSALSKGKTARIKSHKSDFEMLAAEFEEQLQTRDAQIKELQTKYNELKKKHTETVHTLAETQKALRKLTAKYTELQEAAYRDRVVFEAKIKEEQNKVYISFLFILVFLDWSSININNNNDSFPSFPCLPSLHVVSCVLLIFTRRCAL